MKYSIFRAFFIGLFSIIHVAHAQLDCLDFEISPLPLLANDGNGGYQFQLDVINNGPAYTGASAELSIAGIPSSFDTISYQQNSGPININPGSNILEFSVSPSILEFQTFGTIIATASISIYFNGDTCVVPGALAFLSPTTEWGCTDPAAINYDVDHIVDIGNCAYDFCEQLFAVENAALINGPNGVQLNMTLLNTSDIDLDDVGITYTLTADPPITIDLASAPTTVDLPPGGFQAININVSGVEIIDESLDLQGFFTLNSNTSFDTCEFSFENVLVNTNIVGCTDPSAYNFSINAQIDNGQCIALLEPNMQISNPLCDGNPGNVEFTPTGGTPPYNFNFNTFDPEELLPGNYLFSISDNSPASKGGPFTEFFFVFIEQPFPFEATILADENTLVAGANQLTSGIYTWLLNGAIYAETLSNEIQVCDSGLYSVYVETVESGTGEFCFDYSNILFLNPSCLSTEEDELLSLEVFPNPSADGKFYFSKEVQDASVQVFDSKGSLVHQLDGNLEYIDMSHTTDGLYHLVIQANGFAARRTLLMSKQ